MRFLLIRHADPDYARDSLTEKGFEEASALAEHLAGIRIDALYISPMGRAQATASPLAERKRLTPIVLEWLRELNGNWEGNRMAWKVTGAENLDVPVLPNLDNWHTLTPYGAHLFPQYQALGENFDALIASYGYRREGFRYRVEKSNDAVVACVTHGGLILTLLSYLLHWPLQLVYSHLCCDPTGINDLQWEEHGGYAVPRAKVINGLSHL